MKIVALITSRLESTRLPGKALLDICGKPMVERVYDRTKAAKLISETVIATTARSKPIRDLCATKGMKYFVGSEDDILGRLYFASRKYEADTIVRVWGDSPLVDPELLDTTIKYYMDNDANYVTNVGFPAGLNTAVISYGSLQKAHRNIKNPAQRMWIHKYFIDNADEFRVGIYGNRPDWSFLDWSVDTMWDLRFARIVYEELGENFHWQEVLKLLCKAT